jgi:hypothetical protein
MRNFARNGKRVGLGAAYLATLDKLYNPDQPRVPAGSGRISGQWTRVLSFLADLSPKLAEGLGRFGAGLMLGASADAVAGFGLLFIPLLAAAGDRQLVWVFSDAATAEHVRQLFAGAGGGRGRIGILVVPWLRSSP